MKILSIEAWGNSRDGYEWNSWHKIGEVSKKEFEILNTNRKILKFLRNEGYLSDMSKGRVLIDDDQYNIVICDRSRKPLLAIEYGPEY